MRRIALIAALIAALLVVDAVGFGGKYRLIVKRELLFINPFKRMMRFSAAGADNQRGLPQASATPVIVTARLRR